MLKLIEKLSRSRATHRSGSYALAIALVMSAHAVIGMRAAQMLA